MKTLIFSLIFFSFTMVKSSNEYILIEHIGISDKPITTIILSESAIELDNFASNFILCNESYNSVKDTVFQFCEKYNVDETKDFGSFRLAICEENKKLLDCQINREKSNQLFLQLISIVKQTKGNEDLVIQLETVYNRIKL